jgi:hypothetical protein
MATLKVIGIKGALSFRWESLRIPFLAGLTVLAFGYVALLLFWIFGTNPSAVPDLFHYPDATWGDGLFLPVLAFCLQILISRLDKPSTYWPTWIASAVGAGTGALLVTFWWTDPRPSPNWTLPRPHTFTLAGQWHAAFLISASGLFAGTWIELFRRIRASDEDRASQVLASPITAVSVACTAGYACLAVADSARSVHTISSKGSLVAVAVSVVVLIFCLKWSARGSAGEVARSAVAGLLLAGALVVFTDTYGKTGPFMLFAALAGALGAGVALAGAPDHENSFRNLEIVAVSALYAMLVLLAAHTASLLVAIADPIAALVFSAGLRWLYGAGADSWRVQFSSSYIAGSGISASLLAAGAFGLWLSAQRADDYITAGFLLTIIGAVLGGLFLPYYRVDYIRLMEVEGDRSIRQPDHRASDTQHQVAIEAWLRLCGYAVSSTASMLVLTVALAPSLGWQPGAGHISWKFPLIIGIIGLTLILPTAGAVNQSRQRHPKSDLLFVPRNKNIYIIASSLAGLTVSVLGAIFLAKDGVLNILAVVQCAFLTAFIALNMVNNGALLHARHVRPWAWLSVTSNCSAVFITVYWSLTIATQATGSASPAGAAFAAFVAAVLLVATLTVTASCVTFVSEQKPYRTDYPPIAGVRQDCFLMTCMWFLLAWTPQLVLSHIPDSAHERWAAVGTVLAGFLLLFGPAYLWILENNDTHVERQRHVREVESDGVLSDLTKAKSSADRIKTLPRRIGALLQSVRGDQQDSGEELTQREFIIRLSGHTAAQNAISMVLAISTIVGIVGVSSGLAPTAIGVTEFKKEDRDASDRREESGSAKHGDR